MPSTPPANAQTTTLQVMSYNAVTDGHTLVLDLNDHGAFTIRAGTLKLPQPPKSDSRSFNLRTPGERIVKWQYKNRHVQVQLNLRALTPSDPTSTTQLLTDVRNLLAAIEHPPYELRLALPKATAYSYADVVQVTHTIPADPQEILAGAIRQVAIDFECLPGLRGDRLTLQNLVWNPGFEAPSGPAVVAFSDTFANFNAYTVQAGGALAQDSTTYADTVLSNASLLRYYRLDEASGTTVYDASPSPQNGTTHGSPTQGVTGLLTGDSDTCYTFASASSQYVSLPSSGMPTGAGAFTIVAWLKFASNPASNAYIASWGLASTNNLNVQFFINTSGQPVAGTTGTVATGSALSTGTRHMVAYTYDGANIRLYVDGSLVAGPTAATLNIPSSPSVALGALAWSLGNYFNGQLDEMSIHSTALAGGTISTLWSVGSTGPTANQANTMVVPSGGRVSFGSPVWSDLNTWQVRFRYVSSLTATFYLHYTDANNYLAAVVTGTSLTLNHVIGGTTHQLATTSAPHLVPGAPYWLVVTQFPWVSGNPAMVQARLFADNAGTLGATAQSVLVGPTNTYDTVTALSGKPQLAASGAALSLGGSYAITPHTCALFKPGGWTTTSAGTGVAAFSVDGGTTYPSGPVTSFAAGRVDAAPAGTLDAKWQIYTGGSAPTYAGAGTWAMPVAAPLDVLGLSAMVKTSAGFGNTATLTLQVTEYNAAGTQLRQNTAATLTGPQTSWTALSANYTTGASCAYVDLALRVLDSTTNSAGQQVWWDNAQAWDQTTTGQSSMPYGELRFPQAPAQVVVSGVTGDPVIEAPCLMALGTYLPGAPWAGNWLQFVAGRAANYQPNARLIGQDTVLIASLPNETPALDATAYGGFTTQTGVSANGNYFTHSQPLNSAINGIFHLYARWTPATRTGLGVQVSLTQSTPGISSVGIQGVQIDNATISPSLTLNVPATLDGGQVMLPPTGQSSLATGGQAATSIQYGVLSGGAGIGIVKMNWLALVPVDDTLSVVTYNTYSFTNPQAQWLWLYIDGLSQGQGSTPSTTSSIEGVAALANPAGGLGGPTTAANWPAILPTADSYLTLNPALAANQMLCVIADDAGDVVPLAAEIQYSPLYLYPR